VTNPSDGARSREPDVSIVIVAHSVRHELERCLGSIRDHADVDVETILVDNASTDGTPGWVRSAHPDVRLVLLERNEGTIARGRGILMAAGRYTMLLDSDAALTPGALPAMVAAMDHNPAWGLLGPRLVGDDGELQPSCRRFPPPLLPLLRRPPLSGWFEDSAPVRRYLMEDVDYGEVRPVIYVLGACQLFRTDLAARARPFPDWVFLGPDDVDWCISIRDAGGEIVYWPQATVVHSYQRRSRRNPFSRFAWLHLKAYAILQWRHRRQRKELDRLANELDRRAAEWQRASGWPASC
jgi:GT2 family glycosyltransferase